MIKMNFTMQFTFCVIIVVFPYIFGQKFMHKPWPSYSLQNMPQTQFTCHDKILGGYYADSETQCQMFHVCVKVSGIGVQDFRFLCPNGTAFDQEAQICADWGDVDCEQSVLYYGSDNFDLYRIGSGFESKRAPLAEEDEAVFHLQRAESVEVKRSKETHVDQKLRPDQPPNYSKHVEPTVRKSFYNFAYQKENIDKKQHHKQQPLKEIDPVKITSNANSDLSLTNANLHNIEFKYESDDIFKGSHSSHFFSNRNNGREDLDNDHKFSVEQNKTLLESIAFNRKPVQPTRSKRIKTSQVISLDKKTKTVTSTIAPEEKSIKKVSLKTFYNTNQYSVTTRVPRITNKSESSTVLSSTIYPQSRVNIDPKEKTFNVQEYIQPTTYNPGIRTNHIQTSTTKSAQYQNKSYQPLQFQLVKTNRTTERSVNRIDDIVTQSRHLSRVNNNKSTNITSKQSILPLERNSTVSNIDIKPRGFVNRGNINYKETTQRTAEKYSPTVSNIKKFSTLVTKGQNFEAITTFKPTTYNKPYEKNYLKFGFTQEPSTFITYNSTIPVSISSKASNVPDENDGQYHPELYEIEYNQNRFKKQRLTTTPKPKFSINTKSSINYKDEKGQQQSLLHNNKYPSSPSDMSDEEEIFKTAHSLNFGAASINKLRADIFRAEKTSQKYNSQYIPTVLDSSLNTTTSTSNENSRYAASEVGNKPYKSINRTFTSTVSPIKSFVTVTTLVPLTKPPKFDKSTRKSISKSEKSDKNRQTFAKSVLKHPPHVDNDNSYDYAYYDTDTLSESPQEYSEYEIAEFTKTRKH